MEAPAKGQQQVPAFGCWNQHYYCDDDLAIGQYFDSSELFRRQLHREVTTMKQQQQTKRVGKAVDEDLYKVPPEILHRKAKRRLLRKLWGCMRVSSIEMD